MTASKLLPVKILFASISLLALFGIFVYGNEFVPIATMIYFFPHMEWVLQRCICSNKKWNTVLSSILFGILIAVLLVCLCFVFFCPYTVIDDLPGEDTIECFQFRPTASLLAGKYVPYSAFAWPALIIGCIYATLDIILSYFSPLPVVISTDEREGTYTQAVNKAIQTSKSKSHRHNRGVRGRK